VAGSFEAAMKYQIFVEKQRDEQYLAYSPLMPHLRASATSLDGVLADIHQGFLCFLHDPDAEMEVIVKNKQLKSRDVPAERAYY
jgi:predicted RNase H-like HicB family nuclease